VSKLRLFVVRHGETAWSRERRFAGARDIPLDPEGLRQCEAVARALAPQVVAAVHASPLERARASAEVIAKPHRLPVETDPAFSEMAFGEWEGLTREEVAARFPAAYEEWRHAPHLLRIAGGETLAAVAERARGAVQQLAAAHTGETVVLVTHAIVTRLIVLDALGLGPERLWTVDATPAGITEIEYEPGWATIHRMNTLAHLEAAAP
jgi:broad specificity phosphatase PhoE